MSKKEKQEKRDCPVCGTKCKIVKTCRCGDSGCDGSPKLVPLTERNKQ